MKKIKKYSHTRAVLYHLFWKIQQYQEVRSVNKANSVNKTNTSYDVLRGYHMSDIECL